MSDIQVFDARVKRNELSIESTSPTAHILVAKKVVRTQFQWEVLKFRVSQVFVGSSYKFYHSLELSLRIVSFSIENLNEDAKPVVREFFRFQYGGEPITEKRGLEL